MILYQKSSMALCKHPARPGQPSPGTQLPPWERLMGPDAPPAALPRLSSLLWAPHLPPLGHPRGDSPAFSEAPSPAGKGGVKRCFPECAVRSAPTQGGLWSPRRAEAAVRSSLRAQGSSLPPGDRGSGPEKAPPAPCAHPAGTLAAWQSPAPCFHQQAPSLQLSPSQ